MAQFFGGAEVGLASEVEGLVGAWRAHEDRVAKAIVEWMAWKRRGDIEQLALAAIAVAESGLSRSFVGKIATAFEDAQAKAPSVVETEAVARGRKVAERLRRLDGRRRRRGSKSKGGRAKRGEPELW